MDQVEHHSDNTSICFRELRGSNTGQVSVIPTKEFRDKYQESTLKSATIVFSRFVPN
jgi:hypothetical protein